MPAPGSGRGPAEDRGAKPAIARGVLHSRRAADRFRLAQYDPGPELKPFVDYYWIVEWDLRGRPAHEQKVLPHPNVHLAFEDTGADLHGVDRKLFVRRIEGRGRVLGVRFRPGGFHPFWRAPVSQLNDRVIAASELFGAAAERAREAIMAADGDAEMVAHAERMLSETPPEPDPVAEEVAGMVTRIVSDPALRRTDQLSVTLGVPVRRLQRLFAEYVGVSPKWVMRRARLHDAAERADSGAPVDWAALSADLGYADQAHLTRDFTATIGIPPARYAYR
jgi:AraC-like DNA-binding protein